MSRTTWRDCAHWILSRSELIPAPSPDCSISPAGAHSSRRAGLAPLPTFDRRGHCGHDQASDLAPLLQNVFFVPSLTVVEIVECLRSSRSSRRTRLSMLLPGGGLAHKPRWE